MSNIDIKIRREKTYPYCGRLIVLDGLDSRHVLNQQLTLDNNFSIDFPAMPETLELARQAEYKVVSNMVVPDGVHQYRYTAPLTIPFSFMLHSLDDEYCKDGPLTVLRVAARLHALTVPFGNSKMTVSVANDSPLTEEGKPDSGAASPKNEANQQAKAQTSKDPTFQAAENTTFDPPPTVFLELMYTRESEPGIVCVGYVKDVRAVFKGPWLRGPNSAKAFNLPTSCEYSFTFVHHPGHYNSYSNQNGIQPSQQSNAFSDYILQNLYNTSGLITGGDFRGFTKTGN